MIQVNELIYGNSIMCELDDITENIVAYEATGCNKYYNNSDGKAKTGSLDVRVKKWRGSKNFYIF